jgi:ferredoxin
MVLWFARGLHRGVATTRYPLAEPDAWTRDLPTPPVFNEPLDAAVADAMVAVCPSVALRRTDHILIYDVGACTACGRCMATAPEVVRPSGVFELTATDRQQLIKHITLRKTPPPEEPSWQPPRPD